MEVKLEASMSRAFIFLYVGREIKTTPFLKNKRLFEFNLIQEPQQLLIRSLPCLIFAVHCHRRQVYEFD